MAKKTYTRPALKTEEVKLGVFGDYQKNVHHPGKRDPLLPIDSLDLHIE